MGARARLNIASMLSHTIKTIAFHAALAMCLPASPPSCQCDAGDYWCSPTGDIQYSYNCSGTEAGKQLWNKIVNADTPSHADCAGLQAHCDGAIGAHATPSTNATCDASCVDFCWIRDVGDCADMDDEQIFCVGQCMAYCTAEHCDPPADWTNCQATYNLKHMKEEINFVDYSMCMSTCTDVPISSQQQTLHSQQLYSSGTQNVTALGVICCHDGCGDGPPAPKHDTACSTMPDGATFAFSTSQGSSGCNC